MLKIISQSPSSGGYNIILDNNVMLFLAKPNPSTDEINNFLISIEREAMEKIDILGEENDV